MNDTQIQQHKKLCEKLTALQILSEELVAADPAKGEG